MLGEAYVHLVLATAPLQVCLAWRCEPSRGRGRRLEIPAALLFGLSVLVPDAAVWGAMPWLLLCLWRGLEVSRRCLGRRLELSHLADWAAHLYLPVGGIWAFFSQWGYQPLGFSGIIVLLTGVHFHYAGFALPWLTSRLLARRAVSWSGRVGAVGVLLGVPLVAVGITSSQLGLPPAIETASVTILALSALTVSHGYLAWAGACRGLTRLCFMVGGVALALGMLLALLYGWRVWFPIEWVTIPAMYSLHGSLNSWGFCLPGILGNRLLGKEQGEG